MWALDDQAGAFQFLLAPRPDQERYVYSGTQQPTAKIATDRTSSHYQYSQESPLSKYPPWLIIDPNRSNWLEFPCSPLPLFQYGGLPSPRRVLGDAVTERPILLLNLDEVNEHVLQACVQVLRESLRNGLVESALLFHRASLVKEDLNHY